MANPTPGPWRWDVRPLEKSVALVGARTSYVMDFVRWGMGGAIDSRTG